MTPRMKPLKIAIIGAGVAGLAAASLLARRGHHLSLIERFATPRPLGSGLVLQPLGLQVLADCGAAETALGLGAPVSRMLGHAAGRCVLDVSYPPGQNGLAIRSGRPPLRRGPPCTPATPAPKPRGKATSA
jgi:2-polyprenyl-6-methoxyphenol hydroxylase-like FAD-dependent oxidoreductase